MEDYSVDEIIQDMDFSKNQFQTLKNGLMLTNWEISVLDKYHISYQNCHTLKELLFEIEEVLSEVDRGEDLDGVSQSISERDYYQNTPF